MALSVQNKNFLAVLNKLDIDVKQFPDKTFDGLFENIPENMNYFFNWFIENITPDNALTQLEQTTYFQLESSQSLLSEEEIDFMLSSCSPGYEELMSLDMNYVNNFLPQDLESLTKSHGELSGILAEAESSYGDIKQKQNNLKEEINSKKKHLIAVKQESEETNSLLGSKIDEVKTFLLKEPNFILKIAVFNELLVKEKYIFNEYETSILLENEMFNFSKIDLLSKLEEDLACIEISLILSEGFLKEKEIKVEFLSELLQKERLQKSFNNYNYMNYEGVDIKIGEEIKVLETQLFNKKKRASHSEVLKIYDQYVLNKIELNKSYLLYVSKCRDYVESNWIINSCLFHILLKAITHVENILNLKKQLFSKLNEYETNFTNDITNLEMRKERFKEVSLHEESHPLVLALKNTMNVKENLENVEETLKYATELISRANDDSNFVNQKFRSDLQSEIKRLFDNTLCGPTSQLLFVPVELLIKFQECRQHESNLSLTVKRLASKYVDVKETISKSDRKILLLWIDFLTNLKTIPTKNNPSET